MNEFLWCSYVTKKQGTFGIMRPFKNRCCVDLVNLELSRKRLCRAKDVFRWTRCPVAAIGSVFELKVGQNPALGTTLQCCDWIRNPKIYKGLSADDTSGTASTVNDDSSLI